MGVHGLWDIVGPSARPVRLEALRNKKLAVDASIWIYQFLKAVRDSEGNQLKSSHIVGFFRRICKLLYFGIKPVFVFDGGVPTLKKNTIRKRKEKREGNKESAEQIAKRILAKQLQKYADGKLEDDNIKLNNQILKSNGSIKSNSTATRKEKPTNELYFDVYYDDFMEDDENQIDDGNKKNISGIETENRKQEKESQMFRKQDDYDLPVIKGGLNINESDNRLTTDYEFESLTKDINDDLENVDLDHIDPQSKEFEKLPLSTQYIVLSHLRLRSRLRMGYTKTQLQSLFPDPMEFSKFQIKMVQKRNYFTQKVMNVTGMDGDNDQDIISRRIASDKNRAYNLKRTGDGYALTISKDRPDGGTKEKPLFLDDTLNNLKPKLEELEYDYDSGEDDIDWNDVEVDDGKKSMVISKIVEVENPLFVKDSDEEERVSSSDEESVIMEDVTIGNTQCPNGDDSNDEIMQQIKYLYEYSNINNKKKRNPNQPIEPGINIILSDDDVDEYHEVQMKQIEDNELREAIEKSKKDYLDILNEEKNGSAPKDSLENDPPLILSTSTLAKTLKLPNLSMKSNLLFGGSTGGSKISGDLHKKVDQHVKKKVDKKNIIGEAYEEGIEGLKEEIEAATKEEIKALPLPEWFSSNSRFNSKPDKTFSNNSLKKLTGDEKAGLVSYGEINDYFSSDDDDDVDFLEVPENLKDTIILTDDRTVTDSNKKSFDDSNDKTHDVNFPFDTQKENNMETKDEIKKDSDRHEMLITAKDESINEVENDKHALFISTDIEKTDVPAKTVGIEGVLIGKQREAKLDDDFEFSDDEEVNLLLGMEEENQAYGKFVNNIKGNSADSAANWDFADEARLQEQLRKQKRDSDEVTTNMIYDVQDLLARFGIPFITAPMEAEAQCAELKLLGLVDGIITDDSDCFLFGGDKIYKNLFSEKNFVECYQEEDIREELGLSRTGMIELAILLGSDYTEGIKGVGKVTSMEILAEFKNLENFRNWWMDYQNGKIDESIDTPIKKKLRKTLGKSLFLGNDFPNKLIYEAYIHPEVDHDKSQFKWGYPDLDKLRTFLLFYVGWNKEKVDEILLPVIKGMNKPQTTIGEFFPVEMVQRRRKLEMSKRIKNATDKLKKSRTNNDDNGSDNGSDKRQKI